MTLPYSPSTLNQRAYQVWNSDAKEFIQDNVVDVSAFTLGAFESNLTSSSRNPAILCYEDGSIKVKGRFTYTGATIVAPFVAGVLDLSSLLPQFPNIELDGIVFNSICTIFSGGAFFTIGARLIQSGAVEVYTTNGNPKDIDAGDELGFFLSNPPDIVVV